MKVWTEFGSEHSTNLVIIGHFKSAEVANEVQGLINTATEIANKEEKPKSGMSYTAEMLDFIIKANVEISSIDVEQLIYEYGMQVEGSNLIITTEETAFQVFINFMLSRGAKMEVYSAHVHTSKYGRGK